LLGDTEWGHLLLFFDNVSWTLSELLVIQLRLIGKLKGSPFIEEPPLLCALNVASPAPGTHRKPITFIYLDIFCPWVKPLIFLGDLPIDWGFSPCG
jgi:hypothetical protein